MSFHNATKQEIESILTLAFSPQQLEVIDDSASHRGHKEALLQPKAGHFKVIMTSKEFNGKSPVARHRMVYEKLNHLMHEKVHALSLSLHGSDE